LKVTFVFAMRRTMQVMNRSEQGDSI
jgi:hypothetical protein